MFTQGYCILLELGSIFSLHIAKLILATVSLLTLQSNVVHPWSLQGGAHHTIKRMIEADTIRPMILAMPSDGLWGDGSAYLTHSSSNFEKWIAEDVPGAVRENVPQVSNSSPLFISGLSMGGFGALRIGAKYSDSFSGISAHSSITSLNQMKLFVEEPLSSYKQSARIDEDAFLTIKENRNSLPSLRFDCGLDDLLIEYNRQLHNDLEQANIQHTYQEFDGTHEWSYWENHLADSLTFFEKLL